MTAPIYISECGQYEVWKEAGMPNNGAPLAKALLECQSYFVDKVMPRLLLLQHQNQSDQKLIVEGIRKLSLEEGFYLQAHKSETAKSTKPKNRGPKSIYGG